MHKEISLFNLKYVGVTIEIKSESRFELLAKIKQFPMKVLIRYLIRHSKIYINEEDVNG